MLMCLEIIKYSCNGYGRKGRQFFLSPTPDGSGMSIINELV